MDNNEQSGGVDWELSEAIRLMGIAMANGDPDAIATAMRRHAEALSNQAITKMVEPLKHILESVLKKEISEISKSVGETTKTQDGRFQYILSQLGAFLEKEDSRHDHYSDELDRVARTLGDLRTGQDSLQAEFHGVEHSIEGIRRTVDEVKQQSTLNGEHIGKMQSDLTGARDQIAAVDNRVSEIISRVDFIEEGFDQLKTDVREEFVNIDARISGVEGRLGAVETRINLHDQLLKELVLLQSARERLRDNRESAA